MVDRWDKKLRQSSELGQGYITDAEIIRWFAEQQSNHHSPYEIAESRRRENVIRLQCRKLSRAGLLAEHSHDVFYITNKGRDYHRGKIAPPAKNGQLKTEEMEEADKGETAGILTDVSGIDADNIEIINEDLFSHPEHEYGNRGSPAETRASIHRVKDYRINRVIREFPCSEPLPAQCAHWVSAFAGLHFFPDANHRTAVISLGVLLEKNDAVFKNLDAGNISRAVLESKLARLLHSDVRFNTLWKKDELYAVWHQYFSYLLYDVGDTLPTTPSDQYLRSVLEKARNETLGR